MKQQWKVAPIEPDEEMIEAGHNCLPFDGLSYDHVRAAYGEMMKASNRRPNLDGELPIAGFRYPDGTMLSAAECPPAMFGKDFGGGVEKLMLDSDVAPLLVRMAQLETGISNRWCPDICPITQRKFFLWINHPTKGDLPTYGGPFDSYTLAEPDNEGTFQCERFDHDAGEWTDSMIGIDQRLIDAQRDDCEHGEIEQLNQKIGAALSDAFIEQTERDRHWMAELRAKLTAKPMTESQIDSPERPTNANHDDIRAINRVLVGLLRNYSRRGLSPVLTEDELANVDATLALFDPVLAPN